MAVNLLLSYAFHERTNIGAVRRNLVCGRLMVDSGAFTAWSKGRPISLDAYAGFLERWRGCWDHAITLDVIGDGKASAANTRKLHERGLPVMPVFTRGDSLAEFDAMVADVGYVCAGGLVGLPTKTQLARVQMLQRRAQDAGGGIHALGIGSMATLRAARPYSADASSVSGAFRFGTVVFFDGREIRNVPITDRARLARNRDHLRAHGVDLAKLATTGRMPGQHDGRKQLMQAMSLAYACADEWLRASHPVPPPRRLAQAGTHLFSSISPHASEADWASELDANLHGTHLFASVNNGGGPRTQEAETLAEVDASLHGTHLYSAMVGKNDNAERVAETDRALHGTHLYNSLTPSFTLEPAAGLDRDLHRPEPPPSVWRVHGRHHVCRQRAAPSPEPEATHAI